MKATGKAKNISGTVIAIKTRKKTKRGVTNTETTKTKDMEKTDTADVDLENEAALFVEGTQF